MRPVALMPPSLPPTETYSHGVAWNNLVFIGGQVGQLADGTPAARDMRGQVAQALRNVSAVLALRGGTLANLVQLAWFTTDMGAFLKENDVKHEFYTHKPADFVVEVSRLAAPEWFVEVSGIAVIEASPTP